MRQFGRYFAILAISFVNLLPSTPVILAQTKPSSFKDIRAVYTAEFGVPHPNGFAFLAQSKGFILWGGQSDSQEAQLISDYEDPSSSLTLPVTVEDPLAAAFDSRSNSLVMWSNGAGELVTVGMNQNGVPDTSGKNVVRYSARIFDIQMAQGVAFDPASGRLFILDEKGPQIVSVTPDPSEGFDADVASRNRKINRIKLNGFENTRFRGLGFNPKNSHLYVGAPGEQKVYEFDQNGEAVSTLDLGSLQLATIQALTFAPSADTTDDPAIMNLFVLDSGVSDTQTLKQSSGQILELTLGPQALPGGTTLLPSTLVRTFSTSNTVWNPSSPDPSGIDYWPPTGGLIIDDSEVDEMSNYFAGKNMFLSTRSGALTGTCSTTNLSLSGFSNEPTGLAVNPNNNNIFISDDDARKIFEVRLGADGAYCTADDTVASVDTTTDTEDVAYGNNTLFISGGTDAEVFMFNLGANGVLGGGDDGPVTHFDTGVLGFSDLEGIGYNSDSGTLFIVSTSSNDRYLGEVTTTGTLLRAYDLSFMGTASNIRSDVAFAPSSQNPAVKNIYIASRGVDNDVNPNENDGKVWEISLPSGGGDTTGVFRPSNGSLYLKNSNTTGFADIAINYGIASDYPVVGDWDGNGTTTIGIYRNGSFYLRNSNTVGFADWVFPFGQAGDQPIAGDWNGDGIDTIGIFRPSNGQFLLRNSNDSGPADAGSFFLGNPGDVGIAGDWTGKGYDTVGVFRPSNGALYLKNTNQTGFADIQINYGLPGDQPITGDWNNDGKDTIGVYRNGQFLLRNSNTIGFADIVFSLGNPGDMPIAGNWDGLP